MKYYRLIWFIVLVVFATVPGCSKDNGGTPSDTDYELFSTEVPGLSGLCFTAGKNNFYAISDNGSIYEINKDGSTIRNLGLSGNNDFEAISLDAANDKLYVADESLMNIFWLMPNQPALNLVTHIAVSGGVSNKGIEGLSFGRDTLYIVNQESPTILIKYALASQAETSRINIDFAGYLSDTFFDDSDNTIWICDSQQKMIFHCTLNGELIGSQEISFVPKAEALVIDRAGHTAWVGCDQSSGLYKIKLKI